MICRSRSKWSRSAADLYLPLKAIYFDQIAAGTKTEEYRQATAYWVKRLEGKTFDRIVLMRGYPAEHEHDRKLVRQWRGLRRTIMTHEHFGTEPVDVFVIDVSTPA